MKINYTINSKETVEIEVTQEVLEGMNEIDEKTRKKNRTEAYKHDSLEQLQVRGLPSCSVWSMLYPN